MQAICCELSWHSGNSAVGTVVQMLDKTRKGRCDRLAHLSYERVEVLYSDEGVTLSKWLIPCSSTFFLCFLSLSISAFRISFLLVLKKLFGSSVPVAIIYQCLSYS